MMRSLRSQLTVNIGVATSIVLILSGLVIYFAVRTALFAEFDRALEAQARGLAALFDHDYEEIQADLDLRMPGQFKRTDAPEYFQAWLDGRQVIAVSPTLGNRHLDIMEVSLEKAVFRSARLPDGRAGRLIGLTFYPHDDHEPDDDEVESIPEPSPPLRGRGQGEGVLRLPSVTLVVTAATADVDRTLARLLGLLAMVAAIGIALSCLLQMTLVRRGLRPLNAIGSDIERIDARDLTARLRLENSPHELSPIVSKLNDLLTRLEAAFNREASFTSDVAHELRTPLTGLRSNLEVGLSKERSPAQYKEFLASCLKICGGMQHMIESLLALTRLDAGQLSVQRRSVAMTSILCQNWSLFEREARKRNLDIQWDLQDEAHVEVDPEHLNMIVKNLFDNAVCYANEGGSILIEVTSNRDHVTLRLSNTGSRIPSEKIDSVFDRFWRGSLAREESGRHAGLGLAITKRLVELNRGEVQVQSELRDVFSVRILFESAPNGDTRADCGAIAAVGAPQAS